MDRELRKRRAAGEATPVTAGPSGHAGSSSSSAPVRTPTASSVIEETEPGQLSHRRRQDVEPDAELADRHRPARRRRRRPRGRCRLSAVVRPPMPAPTTIAFIGPRSVRLDGCTERPDAQPSSVRSRSRSDRGRRAEQAGDRARSCGRGRRTRSRRRPSDRSWRPCRVGRARRATRRRVRYWEIVMPMTSRNTSRQVVGGRARPGEPGRAGRPARRTTCAAARRSRSTRRRRAAAVDSRRPLGRCPTGSTTASVDEVDGAGLDVQVVAAARPGPGGGEPGPSWVDGDRPGRTIEVRQLFERGPDPSSTDGDLLVRRRERGRRPLLTRAPDEPGVGVDDVLHAVGPSPVGTVTSQRRLPSWSPPRPRSSPADGTCRAMSAAACRLPDQSVDSVAVSSCAMSSCSPRSTRASPPTHDGVRSPARLERSCGVRRDSRTSFKSHALPDGEGTPGRAIIGAR